MCWHLNGAVPPVALGNFAVGDFLLKGLLAFRVMAGDM
jgi:hypothetical protein